MNDKETKKKAVSTSCAQLDDQSKVNYKRSQEFLFYTPFVVFNVNTTFCDNFPSVIVIL